MLLEEALAPAQYDTNIAVMPGSSERVEYAIRLLAEDGAIVHLPIDAKFPWRTMSACRQQYEGDDKNGQMKR